MCIDIRKKLSSWQRATVNDELPGVFLVKGGGKAFCAGGDVKTIWQAIMKSKSDNLTVTNTEAVSFFSAEYEMNYLLGTSPVPQVSIWDGIVMGGGVGLSVLGDYRVATENTLFAMPECAIGIFPDVGTSWWLNRLPVWQPSDAPPAPTSGCMGVPRGFEMYVGMTGARLGAADLVAAGIATHFVASDRVDALERELETRCPAGDVATRNAEARQVVGAILDGCHADSLGSLAALGGSSLVARYGVIAETFGEASASVEGIIAALERVAADTAGAVNGADQGDDKGDDGRWARGTLALLRKQSPTSLKLTYEQLRRGRRLLSLGDCLRLEYRLMLSCIGGGGDRGGSDGQEYGDFMEGIRAVLVDKDGQPRWNPATLEGVTADRVHSCFGACAGGDLDISQYARGKLKE